MLERTLIALALASSALHGADLDCEDLLPETTFLVVEVSDLEGQLERFGRSPLWRTMGDGESLDGLLDDMMEGLSQEYGVDPDGAGLPARLGAGLYVSFNEDLGIEVPAFLAMVDFGDNEPMARAMYEAQVDQLTEEAQTRFDRDEMRGREMLVVESDFEVPSLDEFTADAGMMMPIGGDTDFVSEALSTVYVIRDKARILIGSDPIALDDALVVIDGGKAKVLADDEVYRSLVDMAPDAEGGMSVRLMTGSLQPLVGPLLAGPMIAGVMPIVLELFGDVQGYAFHGGFTEGGDVTRGGVDILIDGDRRGLMKLVDVSRPVTEIPACVPDSAISYGRIDFDFKNLVPTLRGIIGSLPEAEAQQIEPMFEQFAPMVQGGVTTLGPEIHVFAVETDSPFSPTRTTMVIPTSDAESLQQLFGMMAPAMGMMPRDFNGETIYSDPLDEFSQQAIGIGAGSLIIGDSEGVEAVLRAAGQKDLPRMSETRAVREVTRALPAGDLLGWGLLDVSRMLAAQEAMMQMMPMMLDQAGLDMDAADLQDEMERMLEMDGNEFKSAVGPGWWYMKSTDSGMVLRAGVMNPTD